MGEFCPKGDFDDFLFRKVGRKLSRPHPMASRNPHTYLKSSKSRFWPCQSSATFNLIGLKFDLVTFLIKLTPQHKIGIDSITGSRAAYRLKSGFWPFQGFGLGGRWARDIKNYPKSTSMTYKGPKNIFSEMLKKSFFLVILTSISTKT